MILIFTALESDDAQIIEPKLAAHVPVISTAAAFRYENDVPILIPGINDEHIDILKNKKGASMERIYCPIAKLHYYWACYNSKAYN